MQFSILVDNHILVSNDIERCLVNSDGSLHVSRSCISFRNNEADMCSATARIRPCVIGIHRSNVVRKPCHLDSMLCAIIDRRYRFKRPACCVNDNWLWSRNRGRIFFIRRINRRFFFRRNLFRLTRWRDGRGFRRNTRRVIIIVIIVRNNNEDIVNGRLRRTHCQCKRIVLGFTSQLVFKENSEADKVEILAVDKKLNLSRFSFRYLLDTEVFA